MTPTILIVDDDTSHRRMLEAVLADEGFLTGSAADGLMAVQAVQAQAFDLVLMDIRMPAMDGITAIAKIRAFDTRIPIILMTAFASVSTAVQALKAGAADYLIKPIDIDELKILIDKTLRQVHLEQENQTLKERLQEQFQFSRIIGRSPAMRELFATMTAVAPTEATALITGKSGTGKELIANALHQHSPRREGPFVAINCAALSETLLESELFGHEKGAFTGALTRTRGRFRQAHTGTLFLDEIGEMGLATQVKILRALQEREIAPVGGERMVKVDVRIIAATNKDLTDGIREGTFREDLYYRLNVIQLNVPALKERDGDIPLLATAFLEIYATRNQRLIKGFTPRVMELLQRHTWPGNVRELENIIERAVILCQSDMIRPEDLPATLRGSASAIAAPAAGPAAKPLKELERDIILATLAEHQGNRTHTAEILGISRRTLQLKLKSYGLAE